MTSREQLECIVQKKKVAEVYQWFHEHFITSSRESYMHRCPFLVIQGPTGCGKTSTLKCVARELKISIQDYSETTDTTAINYDMAGTLHDDSNEERTYTIDKRKASKFERFVIEHLRFTTLYPASDEIMLPSADSEFESDDDFPSTLPNRPPPKPKTSGIIIHLEAPLSFARSQRVLIQTIVRLMKFIRDLSAVITRRIAIVFENLDCEKEMLSLPTRLKSSLGIQTIKFNPIIKANMKRFVEVKLGKCPNIIVDKEAIDLLINDCDGDLRACINTLELIRNRTTSFNGVVITNEDMSKFHINDINQVSKRQRLTPQRVKLSPNLLRDVTKSLGFFHTLGKIFYQKRLYPERYIHTRQPPRSVDRPYRTENSTEYLTTRLDTSSKNLIAWLHQHFSRFCHSSNISKAATFLEHLSDVDTISIDATQSSQFYEMHHAIDQMQSYLAIEATVYSLYEDQSKIIKSSHKKVTTNHGTFIVKSSVENSSNSNGDLYSFSKPTALSVSKLIDDHRTILSYCKIRVSESSTYCQDQTKLLVDYVPYMNHLSKNLCELCTKQRSNGLLDTVPLGIKDIELTKYLRILEGFEFDSSKVDFEKQHEEMLDTIEELELKSKPRVVNH